MGGLREYKVNNLVYKLIVFIDSAHIMSLFSV